MTNFEEMIDTINVRGTQAPFRVYSFKSPIDFGSRIALGLKSWNYLWLQKAGCRIAKTGSVVIKPDPS